jgi:hypothetical protein
MSELPPTPSPAAVIHPSAIEQHVVWVALPDGRQDDDIARLSVYLSPRARSIASGSSPRLLREYLDFVRWQPEELSFEVHGLGDPIPARIASEPDPEYWPAFFRPETPVVAHAMRRRSHLDLHSYSLADLTSWLRAAYTALATTDDVPEPGQSALGLAAAAFSTDPEIRSDVDELDDWIRGRLSEEGAFRSDAPGFDDRKNLHLLRRFHEPQWEVDGVQDSEGRYERLARPERPLSTAPEFHQILGMLNNHPELLRKLGLVYDLQFPFPRATGTAVAPIEVHPIYRSLAPVHDITPATRTVLATFRAAPASAKGPLSGHLPIGTRGDYEVVTIDADGSGMKAMSFASELDYRARAARERARLDVKPAPPALRSAGIQLAQRDRAHRLRSRFEATESLDDGLLADHRFPQPLTAEDITRGLRPDVFEEETGAWRSLTGRIATYAISASEGDLALEDEREGIVTSGVTATADKPEAGLRVGEALFQWTGWSLVAPRPGRGIGIGEHEFPDDTGNYPDHEHPTSEHLPITLRSQVRPGSLPRLRYGWRYRLRVRTVDLAGNSVPLDEAADVGPVTTELTPYGRFEPIEHPTLLAVARRTPGEQIERLVVRSSDFPGATENTPECERHLAPPKTSQLIAEQHGMFDVRVAGESPLSKGAYADIARRESNSFAQTYDPDTGQFTQHGVEQAGTGEGIRFFPDLVDDRGVPYLPDPMAKRLWLRGLPGSSPDEWLPFPGDWPDHRTVRLRLRKADDSEARTDDGEVIVTLAPAERRSVRVSCAPTAVDADHFGQFQWVQEDRPAQADALRQRIANGSAWAVTPWRTIELVHAVRQPLRAPDLHDEVATRSGLGATAAVIRGSMSFSRSSTSRVDALATWVDPVDGGPGSGPPTEQVHRRDHAFAIPLDRDEEDPDEDDYPVDDRHEFGDTKHHEVTYELQATTAFAEYFTKGATFPWTGGRIALPSFDEGIVTGSVRVRGADGTVFEADRDFVVDHDAGSIAGPRGSAGRIAVGDDVRVTWLPNPITRDGGPSLPLHVPASTRPLPPIVRDVVPTFAWSTERSGSTIRSERLSDSLRIVLDRPWWSSGGEELLGVVLLRPRPSDQGAVPAVAEPYVSMVGVDPTVTGEPAPLHLRPANFIAVGTRTHQFPLALPELPGFQVDVVGHAVELDTARDAWVCDLLLDTGEAYRPFIRLALCRYQPYALTGCHLSGIVLTDILQLAPDRSAIVQRLDRYEVRVTVRGPSPESRGEVSGEPSFARVLVEEHRYPLAGDAGWQQVRQATLKVTDRTRGIATWSGTVSVRGLSSDLRLVVEQGDLVATGRAVKRDAANGERLIHQDIIAVPPAPGRTR